MTRLVCTQNCVPWLATLRATALCILFLLAAGNAFSQVSIYVQATAKDSVGRQIVYELREGIRRSAAMDLADRAQDGRITIRIVTMDPDDGSPGRQTVYSAVFTVQTFHSSPVEMYLTNYVGICGANRTASCAQGLVAIADEQATDLKGMLRDMAEEGRKRR